MRASRIFLMTTLFVGLFGFAIAISGCDRSADAKPCPADCTKPCCADKNAEAKACEADCTKPCCADKEKAEDALKEAAGTMGDAVSAVVEQKTCPVMGSPINKELFVEYKGKKVYFCCAGCEDQFNADPEKYISKLPQFAK